MRVTIYSNGRLNAHLLAHHFHGMGLSVEHEGIAVTLLNLPGSI